MANDSITYGILVVGVTLGLALLVYGMSLTAGQSMNTPALVGGLISLGSVGIMVLKVARLPHPTH